MWCKFTAVFERRIKSYAEVPINHHIVSEALVEYNRPNDKISQLIRRGDLIALRRGLYIPGPNTELPIPDLFLIANHLRGPSYVSLESAFSYWGMIPERVFTVSSATTKTSKVYSTEVGRFEYRYLPFPYYSFGLRSEILSSAQRAIVASPEKALCDKIILTAGVNLRSQSQTIDFLFEDLRLDEEMILDLDIEEMALWIEDAPKKSSLEMLVKTIRSLC